MPALRGSIGRLAMAPSSRARVAGLLYLIVIAAGAASLVITPSLIVPGNAAATANNIMASETAYRFGIFVNLIATAAYVGVVAMLFELLRPAGASFSAVAAFFGLTGCIVSAVNGLTWLAPLALLKNPASLAALETAELQALSFVWLRLSGAGGNLALTFFGFYCLTLGFTIAGATFLPRVLGLLLAISGVVWLTGGFATLLAPAFASQISTYTMATAVFGESMLTMWLLLFGVNDAKWSAQAGRS